MNARHAWTVALLVAVLAGGAGTPGAQELTDPTRIKTFEVRFKPLSDAADLVGSLLSDKGSLTLHPRLKRLVVEDRASVLLGVEQLLASFDQAPRNVEITFILFLGSDLRDKPARPISASSVFSEQVAGVIDALRDFTKWTSYEPLGSRSVTGQEGSRTDADLSQDYRVSFVVDAVSRRDGKEIVSFDRIVLQRVHRNERGEEEVNELYTTAGTLKTGMLHVAGAASGPEADRALFLTMQVEAK